MLSDAHARAMAYSGPDAMLSLRRLAGPHPNAGSRLLALSIVLAFGLLAWALLVLWMMAGWSFAPRAFVTLLLALVTGAGVLALLRTPSA